MTNVACERKMIHLLLVEDNLGDQRLTMEVLKDSKVYNKMYTACDGVEALAFLRKEGKYADVPTPDLILLDLNMPRKDGREVLAEIKADAELRRIPVLILTTSAAESDIKKTLDLHANCYITKPVDLDQFANVIKTIEEFWFGIVRYPGITRDSD
jgi:chemotaxis family two-component system response regulator Rcp1